MNARFSQCVLAVALAALALLATASAQASVSVLTGGDPGEGYDPGFINVYAYHFSAHGVEEADYNPSTITLQGVPFAAFIVTNPNETVGSVTITNGQFDIYPQGSINIGDSATNPTGNDAALKAIVPAIDYPPAPNTAVMTTTLNGLVAGQSYQIDVLLFQGGPQEELFTFQGSGSPSSDLTDDLASPLAGTYYDISENVVANASGIIDFKLTTNGSAPINPYYGAFSVTITPEPASMALLASGSLLLLRRRRA